MKHSQANASSSNGHSTPHTSKLAELRAKLIARRNTPTNTSANDDIHEDSGDSATASKPELKEDASVPVVPRKDTRMDIDGLLAEGRAAADANSKAKQSVQQQNQTHPKKNLTINTGQHLTENAQQTPSSSNPTNHQYHDSTDSVEAGEIGEDAALTSKTTVNAAENFKTPTNPRSRPGAKDSGPQKLNSPTSEINRPTAAEEKRHVSEKRPPPPMRHNTMSSTHGQDQEHSQRESTRPAPQANNMSSDHRTSLGADNSSPAHRWSTTTDSNVHIPDHLRGWLELTGWFNVEYRERVIGRHQRRKQLNQEMAKLAQEEEADKDYLTRAHSASIMDPYGSSSKPPAFDTPVQATTGASSNSMEHRVQHSRKRSLSLTKDTQHTREPALKLARNDNAYSSRNEVESKPRRDEERPEYRIKGAVDDHTAQRPTSSRMTDRVGRSLSPRPRGMTSLETASV